LFEEGQKTPDLKARVAAMRKTPQKSPTGKIEMSQQQMVHGLQGEIQKKLDPIMNITKGVDPSKNEIQKAQKASQEVNQSINAIAVYKDVSPKELEKSDTPKQSPVDAPMNQSINSPLNQATLARQPSVSKTQEMSQDDINKAIEANILQRNQAAYPEAERQRQQTLAQAQRAPTQPLPATPPKQGFFAGVRKRLGLEEIIKEAVKQGLKQTKNR